MNKIPNLVIMASAGTGKTFSLAMRYIRLLKLGVPPEEIVAMTFTNKAAGEIFDKIIQELLGMIADRTKLESAIRDGFLPSDTDSSHLFLILRKILCSPKKLQISTLDSFFFHIIDAFPLECGITGEISMLNEADDELRVDALLRLLRDSSPKERGILLELMKQTSLNTEPFSVFVPARKMIETYYPDYLKYTDETLWDNAAFQDSEILPDDFLKDEELEMFRDHFLSLSNSENKREGQFYRKLADLSEFAVQYTRAPVDFDSTFDLPVKTFFEKDPDWLKADSFEATYYTRVIPLSGNTLIYLQKTVRHLLAVEFLSVINRNRAVYSLLHKFDERYAQSVRRNGKLTFKDIPYLLKTGGSSSGLFDNRMMMEERLDSAYNHYLLDEFQDTSDEQWNVISNLVDEIFQSDPERFRSFFYVGDIKQSIYQWRDGNPALFGAIYRRYSEPGFEEARLQLSTLTRSFRSSLPVIETVNRVFLHPEKIPNEAISEAFAKLEFEPHTSSPSAAAQSGCAMLVECDENGGKAVSAESVFELLFSLNPFSEEHDCSVGVLTLGNDFASEMGERFRELVRERGLEHAFSITVEGVVLLNNSMVFAVYRNLLCLALHPSDPMARGFLGMISLAEKGERMLTSLAVLYGEIEAPPSEDVWFDRVGRVIRSSTASNGFTQFLRRFCRIFESCMADFDETRMNLALDAAMRFDSSGNKNTADFLHYLDCMESKSNSVRKTIQFMTIHKSKGLDFDIVILPELYTNLSLETYVNRGELLVARDSEFQPRWVTHLPKSVLCNYSPGIRAVRQEAADAKTYEKCCLLYVAMTRARNALYMMIPKNERKKDSKTVRFSDLLKFTLEQPEENLSSDALKQIAELNKRLNSPRMQLLYSEGDADWIEKKRKKTDGLSGIPGKAAQELNRVLEHYFSAVPSVIPPNPLRIEKPSAHFSDPEPEQDRVFSTETSDPGGTEFGTMLHELMEQVGFLEETDLERIWSDFSERSGSFLPAETLDSLHHIFFSALSTPDAERLLSRPQADFVELWRERKFSIQREGVLIPCVLDRVVISRDSTGHVIQIQLVDYKSDRNSDPEYYLRNYGDQLDLYASVLKDLSGCVPDKNIFHLRSGKCLLFP